MKYTFLLPAFKGRYLDEMLRSIKAQTYTDFKVLISDDCSPEDLRSICEPYLSDPRFTYRRNEENMGSKSLVSHWNLLVDMCDTDYLIMASDDDVYEPQFLEEIDALVQKYPDVDLFRGRGRMIDGEGRLVKTDFQTEEFQNQYEFLYFMYCQRRLMCIANYVFKRSTIRNINGFTDFPLAWNSDDVFIMQMSGNGVANTLNITFNYRGSGENISMMCDKKTLKKKAKADLMFVLFYKEFMNNRQIPTDVTNFRYYSAFNSHISSSFSNSLYNMAYLLSFSDFRKTYSFLKKTGQLQNGIQKLHFIWSWIRTYNMRKM